MISLGLEPFKDFDDFSSWIGDLISKGIHTKSSFCFVSLHEGYYSRVLWYGENMEMHVIKSIDITKVVG